MTRTVGSGNSKISIHSLRMEGDEAHGDAILSTLGISIHSLRMEGDQLGR